MTTSKRTIVVLGAGNVGKSLGKKWVASGHQVVFGVTNPDGEKSQALREELGESVTISRTEDALAAQPDVVVMAIPGAAMDAAITTHASQLNGRTIIDATNRMDGGPLNSLATFREHTPHAHVFRAFNTLGWENFADPVFNGVAADLFYCGPDGEERTVVEQLISDVGLCPMYLGGVEQVGMVDALASLWFALVFGRGMSRQLALKVLTR